MRHSLLRDFALIADLSFFRSQTYGPLAGFAPTVDGVTLTDTLSRLFQQGKFVKTPTLVGAVNDEGAQSPIRNHLEVVNRKA